MPSSYEAAFDDARKFREFLPNRMKDDPERRTVALRRCREKKMWRAQFELLRRAWG